MKQLSDIDSYISGFPEQTRGILEHVWLTAIDTWVTMREMVEDYLPHFRLHLHEIKDLISRK
jgi:hypothetical protein